VYGVAKDLAKANYDNAIVKYNAAKDARANGIDPRTNKPFILPAPLQKPPPAAAGAAGFAAWEHAQADFYSQVGATNLVTQHDNEAKAYDAQVKADASAAQSWSRMIYTQNREDSRADRTQTHEDLRETIRAGNTQATRDATTAGKLASLKDEAMRAGQSFYAEWAKTTQPPTDLNGTPRVKKDINGKPQLAPDGVTPIFTPAEISPQAAQAMGKVFSTIDRDTDPIGAAEHFADAATSPVQKEMLLARGRYADLNRRSQGKPITPHAWAPTPKAAAPSLPPIARSVQEGRALNKSDDEIKAKLKEAGYPDAEIQQAFPAARPSQLPAPQPGQVLPGQP
jgi:hypothetical protein